MGRKSVAVLDIRSSEVTAFIAESGVNHTFLFKGSKTEKYDGYDNGKFFDAKGLGLAVQRAISAVEQICGERIRFLYVGVPGEFTLLRTKEQNIGFPKKHKIAQKDLDALCEGGKETIQDYRFMRASSMIYVTADNRRVVDPIGISSTGLSGTLSYFYCSEYFCSEIEGILSKMKVAVRYLPTQFAMGSYLIPSETRDEYALFLDIGFLSSTTLVLLGNGVTAQKTFWAGKGQIACFVMEKFNVPLEVALALLQRVNLFSKNEPTEKTEFYHCGISYEYSPEELAETVRLGLDGICEAVGDFLEHSTGRELDYKPLYVTGEGLMDIRGALEHISKRLNRVSEQLVPDQPYYNKSNYSSRIALADMASEDNRTSGLINRIFGSFGG